jgi:hypothetical protein
MFYLSDLLHGGVSAPLILGRISPKHIPYMRKISFLVFMGLSVVIISHHQLE